MAAVMKYQKIIKYLVTAVCAQPLHIGSASGEKEEVLVHPTDDRPFIQASSLAGVLRQYYTVTHGEEQAEGLFGARRFETDANACDGASRVRFGDGVFSGKDLMLELRPRVKIDPVTGTCDSGAIKGTNRQAGHKFQMESVGAGAEFGFQVYLYDERYQADLEEVLAAVHQGSVQFGGQKSNGCGFMKLRSLRRKTFDMTRKEDRAAWAEEEALAEQAYEDITDDLKTAARTAAYEVTVTGSTEGELLVKSIAVEECGKDAPDSMNIRNAAGEYIVPGSSLKGAVRNQMERIASCLGNAEVVAATFGKTGDTRDNGIAGNIVFRDTVVGNREDNDRAGNRSRIHLDKFTGGVMYGGLFQEKNVSGRVEFSILIQDRNHPDSSCGLLLMALRDMAVGMMSIGGGYNVGKGIIDVDRIEVKDCRSDKRAVIAFQAGQTEDESGIIARCMRAVRQREATA